LRYFRDIDGREVDFVVTEGRAPVPRVECQWGDAPPAPGLRYLKARFPPRHASRFLRSSRSVLASAQ